MGCSCFQRSLCFGKTWTVTFLVLGLDGAGKTIVTKRIVGERVDASDPSIPTVGLNTWKTKYRRCNVTLYDIGGGSGIRGIWKLYFQEAHGFIYVVDSTDQARVGECRQALLDCVRSPELRGKPLLVLGNKQDIEGAMDEMELCEALSLEREINEAQTPTRIELCSALKGTSVLDKSIRMGFKWLLETVKKNYAEVNGRVEVAVKRRQEEEVVRAARARERQRRLEEEEVAQDNPGFDGGDEEDAESHAHFTSDMAGTNPFRPIKELNKAVEDRERRAEAIAGDGVEEVLDLTERPPVPNPPSLTERDRVFVVPANPRQLPPVASSGSPPSSSSPFVLAACNKRLPPLRPIGSGRRPISPPIFPRMEKKDEEDEGRDVERPSPEGMESERASTTEAAAPRTAAVGGGGPGGMRPAYLRDLPPLVEVDSPSRPVSVWDSDESGGAPNATQDRKSDANKPKLRVKKKRWNQTSQPGAGILKSNRIAPSLSSSSAEGTLSPVSALPGLGPIDGGGGGGDPRSLSRYRNGVRFSGDVLVRKRSASVSPPRSPQKPLFGKDWTPPGSSGGAE